MNLARILSKLHQTLAMKKYQNRIAPLSLIIILPWILLLPACKKDMRLNGPVNATSARAVTVLTAYEWKFDAPGDLEGWTAGNATIAAAGGGIRSSVEAVRRAGKSDLVKSVSAGLSALAAHGTTTVEAKSGYGLALDAEIKSLQAIRSAAAERPGTVVPTLLGAHVVPSEHENNPQHYIDLVCTRMIPQAARQKLARFVDVFCDRGAFSGIWRVGCVAGGARDLRSAGIPRRAADAGNWNSRGAGGR